MYKVIEDKEDVVEKHEPDGSKYTNMSYDESDNI